MLRTLSNGAGAATVPGLAEVASRVSLICGSPSPRHPRKRVTRYSRDARDRPRGHGILDPRFRGDDSGVRDVVFGQPQGSPPKPFGLAGKLDSLDVLELDGALRHQVVEIAIRGAI